MMDFKKVIRKLKNTVTQKLESQSSFDESSDSSIPVPPESPSPQSADSVPNSNPPSPAKSRDSIPGVRKRLEDDPDSDSPRGAIVQNDIDDSVYNMRNTYVKAIDETFGEYGPKVCAYILRQTLIPNGLALMLAKLNMSSRGRTGADHAVLEAWIRKHGVESFAKRVGIRLEESSGDLQDAARKLEEQKREKSEPMLKVKELPKRRINLEARGDRNPSSTDFAEGTPQEPSRQTNSFPPPPPRGAEHDKSASSGGGQSNRKESSTGARGISPRPRVTREANQEFRHTIRLKSDDKVKPRSIKSDQGEEVDTRRSRMFVGFDRPDSEAPLELPERKNQTPIRLDNQKEEQPKTQEPAKSYPTPPPPPPKKEVTPSHTSSNAEELLKQSLDESSWFPGITTNNPDKKPE